MKRSIYFLIAAIALTINGCELGDKIKREAKRIYNDVKEKYEEYRGEGEQDTPVLLRSFTKTRMVQSHQYFFLNVLIMKK